MNFLNTFLLLCLISTTFCDEHFPIIELPKSVDDVQLRCAGWRVAGEENNLSPWYKIQENFVDYV
ncbi:putative Acid phosphatase [Helianthus anomalus]